MIKVYKIEYPFPDEVKRLSGLGVNVKWSEYNE